uniref:hypothetical protein n=1 Tax=Bacillus subtilis TaxID=1423 RepID=UPI001BDBAA1E
GSKKERRRGGKGVAGREDSWREVGEDLCVGGRKGIERRVKRIIGVMRSGVRLGWIIEVVDVFFGCDKWERRIRG